MNEVISKFQKWLIVNENSTSTIISYVGRVRRLLIFIGGVENLSEDNISEFLLYLKENLGEKTLNCYKDSISAFLKSIKKDIPIPKRATLFKKIPKYFTLKFFEKSLIPMIDLISTTPTRDKALLYFAFFTGLRKKELYLLKRKNFDLEERTVKVIIPKQKEERIVFYTKRVRDLIQIYFSLEEEKKNAFNCGYDSIGNLLRKLNPYFKEIHLHPHLFRTSGAIHLLMQEGSTLIDVKDFLGHNNIQSTMIYTRFNNNDKKKRYDKFMK